MRPVEWVKFFMPSVPSRASLASIIRMTDSFFAWWMFIVRARSRRICRRGSGLGSPDCRKIRNCCNQDVEIPGPFLLFLHTLYAVMIIKFWDCGRWIINPDHLPMPEGSDILFLIRMARRPSTTVSVPPG
jgi:hypothetical protein